MENVKTLEQELQAVIKYTEKNWVGFNNFNSQEFFTSLWGKCTKATKNQFSPYVFTDFIEKFHEVVPKDKKETILINDEIKSSELPMHLLISSMILSDYICSKEQWNYSKICSKIITELKTEFPQCTKVKPNGWSEMKKNYSDYDGMEEFNTEEANKSFEGTYSGTAASSSYPIRIALPYAMHDHMQGKLSPIEILVGAVLGHAYVVSGKINSHQILEELEIVPDTVAEYLEIKKDLKLSFRHPINQAIMKMANYENKKAALPEIITFIENEYKAKKQKP